MEISVKKKNGAVKDFLYPIVPNKYDTCTKVGKIKDFYNKTLFLISPDFTVESEEVINNYAKHRNSQSKWQNFKDDISYTWDNVKETIEEGIECCFTLVDDVERGKTLWEPAELFKDWVAGKKLNSEFKKQHSEKVDELYSLIDQMRTKPFDIEM